MTTRREALNLKALRKVASEATPGEWRVDDTSNRGAIMAEGNVSVGTAGHILGNRWMTRRNATHIAQFSPSTVLKLIDRIEALENYVKCMQMLGIFTDDADLKAGAEKILKWREAVGESND